MTDDAASLHQYREARQANPKAFEAYGAAVRLCLPLGETMNAAMDRFDSDARYLTNAILDGHHSIRAYAEDRCAQSRSALRAPEDVYQAAYTRAQAIKPGGAR